MTTVTAARPTRLTLLGTAGFAIALAAASQIAIPIPGTPVPITLQPLLVVLAGFWLGPVAGAASMALYLGAGALGLPVFAPVGAPGMTRLLGPTGGYLIAYPLAAAVAGALARHARSFGARAGAAVAAMSMIYLGGLAQLTVLTGSLSRAVLLGALPFIALDLAKCAFAALVAPKDMRDTR